MANIQPGRSLKHIMYLGSGPVKSPTPLGMILESARHRYLALVACAPVSPGRSLSHRVPRVGGRRVISGVIHVIRNGLRWCDWLQPYGPPKKLCNLFVRWGRLGVFNRIFKALAGQVGKPDWIMIDATHL
jgi:transposase